VLGFSRHNQLRILKVKVLFETPLVWTIKNTQNKISNLIYFPACVCDILRVIFGSARQKGADEKFGPKIKEEAGGWSNLRNLYSYRSINLYVTRAWLLESSCEVLVAKSDVKGRNAY